MSEFLCHDFKTPRTDMSRRLPPSMRMVPVMFYLVILATGYFVFKDVTDLNQAERDLVAAKLEKDDAIAKKAKLDGDKIQMVNERFRAEAVAKWIEGTRVLQPISVAIARAMPPETNITELSLERSPDLPAQVSLLVRMVNGTIAEVAKIDSSLSHLRYRSHSPQQAKQGDQIEYRSMLVWQDQ